MINQKLFYKVQKLAHALRNNSAELNEQIEKEFGYRYSDVDSDLIIDCLDYGTGYITFEQFMEEMKRRKPKESTS